MRRRLLLAAILLAVLVSRPPLRAEVIISEIMYDPQGTDLDKTVTPNISREWAELYNTGSTAVDITGWQFGDAHDNQWATPFGSGTIIQPHEALVVTGDTASFDFEWGTGLNRIQVGSFPTLANSPAAVDETPTIRDAGHVVQDEVAYDDENGWPRLTGSDGQSIFLPPQALTSTANNVGSNWLPAMRGVFGGTFKSIDGENHGSPGVVDTKLQNPFVPSADAAWSMIIMPDTQNYVKDSRDVPTLSLITNWIKDHRDAFKIKAVLQEGDIVNNNDTNNPNSGDQTSTQQWQSAQNGMFVLNGVVPYIMAAGNHDFGFTDSDNRNTMVNNYFKPTDNPLNDPAQGGILKGQMNPGEIQNAYYAFTAPDGRKMLVIALEWEPRPATVAWANQIAALPEFADYTATLLTHAYLQGNNTRATTSRVAADYEGEELWQGLVKQHDNFELVFNGHFGGDGAGYLASTGDGGNVVHQMFLNSQFEGFGGDGWIRLVEFMNDGKTVKIRTYSPLFNLYRTGADYEFSFQLQSLSVPGDYNGNGVVDLSDYILWRNTKGSTTELAADGNGDLVVNDLDYQFWRERFGKTFSAPAAGQAIVPEPTCAALLLGAFVSCIAVRFRSRSAACKKLGKSNR